MGKVAELLRGTVILDIRFFRYASLFAIRWPHQERTALEMFEDGGSSLW